MKDGESLSAALGADSEMPHRCRESCDFSVAERQKLSGDILPQEFSQLKGPNVFRVNRLLVIQDDVFWDVRSIELFRGWVILFLQEHEPRVREESTFFW